MGLARYIARRLARTALVLLGVVALTYALSRLSDADPVYRHLDARGDLDGASASRGGGGGGASDALAYRSAARELGLDLPPFFFGLSPKPLPDTLVAVLPLARRERLRDSLLSAAGGAGWPRLRWYGWPNGFTHFAGGLAAGRLGYSLQTGEPATRPIARAVATTLPLAALALLAALLLGTLGGLYLGWRRWRALRAACYGLLAAPGFYLTTLAVTQLSGRGRPFPGPGWPAASASLAEWLPHAALPVALLALPGAAYLTLVLADGLRRADRQPIRELALMSGRTERSVWWREMLPLAFVPAGATAVGLLVPALLGGSVVVEYVFNVPGLGRLVLESLLARDWPVVLGVVLLSGLATALGYLAMDLLNAWLDPRWRKIVTHAG